MAVKLERTIRLARLALLWEAIWASVFPLLLTAAVCGVIVFSGGIALLPDAMRFLLLGLFLIALAWAARPLLSLRLPTRDAALRRVELASALDHRPVAAVTDRMAEEIGEIGSRAIWHEHIARQLARLSHIKAGPPRSALKWRDPYALRLAALLTVLAAIFLHRGDPSANFADAVRITPAEAETAMALDAWIRPPAYTGKSPVMLTSAAIADKLARDGELLVPENSSLIIRLTGAKNPSIAYYELIAGPDAGVELTGLPSEAKTEDGAFKITARLVRPLSVRIKDDNGTIADWRIALVPDVPPQVAFTADPRPEPSGALQLAWKASDDYGIAAIGAKLSLSDMQDGGLGIEGNGVFMFDAPQFPIQLKKAAPREVSDTSVNDLTAHPWAGLNVDITLEAKDQAGHVTQSAVKTVKLPEREFQKPLARALIEQRKSLILFPDDPANVLDMLDALLAWPQDVIEKSGVQIAISAVRSHIATARDHDQIRESIDALWQIATAVEEGDVANARAELERIRKELEKALAEGAPPEKIAELMDKLREAMDRYLQSMAEEAQRRMQQNGQMQQMRPGQMITPQDLQKMLDTIDKLARNGANEAAQELLSQLDDILRNLQPGMAGQMEPQRDTPMSQMLDELTDLMRRQQQLMDDTMKMPGGEQGDMSSDPFSGRGEQGSNADKDALAAQQDALRRMLEGLAGRLGEQGVQAPPSLGEAGRAMRGATGSLRQGDRDPALDQQGEALSQLRDGAQNMARQMMQQGTGSQGNYGRHGEARGDDRDPLGRPYRSTGEDYGPERNMLPGEMAIRRAREILEMLRSRANLPDLRRIDRDYIERLLRGLY